MDKPMKRKSVNSGDQKPQLDMDVVHFRLGRAFPELAAWFAWLNGGYAAGAAWQPLLERWCDRIGPDRVQQLLGEAQDVQWLGISATKHLQVLLCNVLGLDPDFLASEHLTPHQAITLFERALRDRMNTPLNA